MCTSYNVPLLNTALVDFDIVVLRWQHLWSARCRQLTVPILFLLMDNSLD